MLENYFKTAWRNLIRNKSFSFINIFGLALGIACSLLIMLWVQDERSVDGFHANKEQLYQVYERHYYDGKLEASYPTQGLLAGELKKTIPEVQLASGFEYASAPGTRNTIEADGKVSKMQGFFAGSDFFSMFSYPLLEGKAANALNSPAAIAISRNMAVHFFGSPNKAIGKMLKFENRESLLVTAVFENIAANSSQQFEFLRSWTDFVNQNQWVNNWGNTSPATFVMLRKEADRFKVEAKIKDFVYRYQEKGGGFTTELALQPYTEKYLHSIFKNGYIDGGRIEYVQLFTIVGVFILLIACVNFMNLATARSTKRAKEVGLRKVIGALRSALIGQFIGEALLLTFFAVIIGAVIAALFLPAFNSLTGKQLSMPFTQPVFWASLAALLAITGTVAGSYPALFLSSLKPSRVLKGTLKFGWGATFFRQGLVVFQFTLSIVLIVGMIVIYRQMNYIQTKNLGYDRENLLYMPIEGELISKYSLFKEQAGKIPGVLTISKMRNSPTVIEHHTGSIEWTGKDPNLTVSFADAVVGYDFIKTLNVKIKEGRDFSREFGTDSASYILNETAVEKIGYRNPVGQTVTWGNRKGTIIGVLEDFHFNSIHQAIEPLIVRLDENWRWGTILVRIEAGKTKEAIVGLENLYKGMNSKFPFTYQFSDQEYTNLYRSENVVSKLANIFAFLAISISCLGLFGLATFTAAQRTKEIGVRKVLGASVPNIAAMLSTNFLKPVTIAMLIAFPVSWYAMNSWLEGFAYKVGIEWWVFAFAGVVTIIIALLTVTYQSVKASLSNPVKSLRTE
ncbi:MAG TPA: ABC transporter permease [Flavitalea sp.]|nr:ABC transporter permease [Flavitalea sp.]